MAIVRRGMPLAYAGTGGCLTAMPEPRTNIVDAIAPAFLPQNPVSLDSAEMRTLVNALLSEFGLNKVQLSSLLQVSRPTLDAWLRGSAGSIRPANRTKVEVLKKVLDDELKPDNKGLLGRMLMKKTHPKIRDFQKSLCNPVLDELALRSAIAPLNQAIRGMLKGDRLADRLKSMPDRI